MDSGQAKKVLILYRKDSVETGDPQTAEALDAVRRDPELATWLEQHRSAQEAIRSKFRDIPVPPDLKRRILDTHVDHRRILHLFGPTLFGLAAAAMVAFTVTFWLLYPRYEHTFVRYRDRMARMVQRRVYFTSMMTGDHYQISDYFRTNGAPTDEALPKNLQKLSVEGGTILPWENHAVSVLCLDAREKGGEEKNDVWVFIASTANVSKGPNKKATEFEKIGDLMTASWTAGNTIYLVVARGGEQDLQKYLE